MSRQCFLCLHRFGNEGSTLAVAGSLALAGGQCSHHLISVDFRTLKNKQLFTVF